MNFILLSSLHNKPVCDTLINAHLGMSGLQLFELAQRFDNISIVFDVLQTIHHESNGRTELLPAVNEKLDTEQATTEQFSEGATTVDFRIVPNFIR